MPMAGEIKNILVFFLSALSLDTVYHGYLSFVYNYCFLVKTSDIYYYRHTPNCKSQQNKTSKTT